MGEVKRMTRGQAIRAKCLDCMCGSAYEVRKCPASDYPLFPYRLGREVRDKELPSEESKISEPTQNAQENSKDDHENA